MIKLNINFNDYEKNILTEYASNNYEILSSIDGDSFILNENGNLFYNDCFKLIDNEYINKQRYQKVIPNRIIKFYKFYLMEIQDERGMWYRGRKDDNGNWEYDSCFDSLEEIFDSL
ncbi:MAG: hypothetical protein K2L15_05040 [Eubacteriales bacterium]|nr:hypothetical protein [Eubacteriales bacterium]